MSSAITPQSPTPLREKVEKALTLARELHLALIICYKMPDALGLEGQVKQVMDLLRQLAEHTEQRGAEFEARNVLVERCFDVLFNVQEVVEGFLDAENERWLERG